MKSRYLEIRPFITRDGSEIRELMHPASGNNQKQSLAEAIVQPGQVTALHRHHESEELYHVTHGHGIMTLGNSQFEIAEGDTVCIPAGTPHQVENTGENLLHILCCCSPAYSHDDTELL